LRDIMNRHGNPDRFALPLPVCYNLTSVSAVKKQVLGYKLPVATIEDVLQGKLWAAQDETRRMSKRQKDLADIMRLVESKKSLLSHLPASLKSKLGI